MKGKVIGGYEFKNKKGNSMASICVSDDTRVNVVGISANSRLCMRSNMPCDLKDMVNKTYIIDIDNIGFWSSFYEVE